MSYLTLTKAVAPTAPAALKKTMYIDTADGMPKIIDEWGLIEDMYGEAANKIRNSGFWYAQRQAPATPTTYSSVGGRLITADGWGVSNENASVTYARIDTAAANEVSTGLRSQYYGQFLKITNAGKMHVSQWISASNVMPMRGRTVRVSMKVKAQVTNLTLRLGIMQLTAAGTQDTIPNGAGLFITAWGGTATDPTLGTNLALLTPTSPGENTTIFGTGLNCDAVTTGWKRFSGTFLLPSDLKNYALCIWTDSQVAANSGFNLSEMAVYDGMGDRTWNPQATSVEQSRVRRFYQKSFPMDTAPAQNAGLGGAIRGHVSVAGATAGQPIGVRFMSPSFRGTGPTTITFYNPSAANAFTRNTTAGTDATATASANVTADAMDITFTGIAAWTVAQSVAVHYSADAEL